MRNILRLFFAVSFLFSSNYAFADSCVIKWSNRYQDTDSRGGKQSCASRCYFYQSLFAGLKPTCEYLDDLLPKSDSTRVSNLGTGYLPSANSKQACALFDEKGLMVFGEQYEVYTRSECKRSCLDHEKKTSKGICYWNDNEPLFNHVSAKQGICARWNEFELLHAWGTSRSGCTQTCQEYTRKAERGEFTQCTWEGETVHKYSDKANDGMAARALLSIWIEAQRSGNFSAYADLYDRDFTSQQIRRDKPVTMTRAEWLEDRKKLFGHRIWIEVPIDNQWGDHTLSRPKVDIEYGPNGEVQLDFHQLWGDPVHREYGSKTMTLVKRGDAYRILTESLHSPKILPYGRLKQFVRNSDGSIEIDARAFEAWGSGKAKLTSVNSPDEYGPHFHNSESVELFETKVDAAALPEIYRSYIGRNFHHFKGNKQVCKNKLTGFVLSTSIWGGYSENVSRMLNGVLSPPCPPATRIELAD